MSFQQLWAPWRLGYILGEKPETMPTDVTALLPGAQPECFLCRCAPAGDDRARLVIERTPQSITVLNRYPYNNGHLLLAPLHHRGRLDELGAEEQLALSATLTRMINLLEKVMQKLQIAPGKTMEDNSFTLLTVNCMGCCALGPVLAVDNTYYSNPSAAEFAEILKNYS